MSALDHAVELLERSLAYTRGTLSAVRPHHLGRPTPCAEWTLAQLLAHMDDGLDAFTEAAGGYVGVRPTAPVPPGLPGLREKACALVGAWVEHRDDPDRVLVGDRSVEATVVVLTGALEMAVHGWDVGRATGLGGPIPEPLAAGLLPVAAWAVGPEDRPTRFGVARRAHQDASSATHLLGHLGRDLTGPPGAFPPATGDVRGLAS
ncbi:TIGR03086 family metal-binding protein [Nocardioides sp. SYSU D00038]|uniref:TIGR03086 family metal-binding protein n=1 Tax=Nocardioides sp. SYSU D00038 TaxID=2812554 RepID=UPI0019677A7A|nr:TIGR03086 family metal-binding protein [Nocardioides sp. SYSU D00038]